MYARRQCFGTTWVGDCREEIDRSDRRYLLPALSPPILTRVPPSGSPIQIGDDGIEGRTGSTGPSVPWMERGVRLGRSMVVWAWLHFT